MESKSNLQKDLLISKGLSAILLILLLPLIYYTYQNIRIKLSLQQAEDPMIFSANRYLYAGDWPASKNNDYLISNFQEFQIIEAEQKPKAVKNNNE
ncbi:hypothetical protein RI844_08275 [Thalassotalea fonticola]|uniref:Uncharacterized protein n=1 Tax=Thalassotalea fonticola TaxID=3065649 RepID=A0ABZ0GTY2_9GAMM|nr:hypothetical protein RI844_08275 [Colwelliaceae bacterium S1-1]